MLLRLKYDKIGNLFCRINYDYLNLFILIIINTIIV